MGNTFGHLFRVSTWGESHGPAIGVVIDGCPAKIPLSIDDIQPELTRRRPGQSKLTTQRREADHAEILSGVFEGFTTGTPISIIVWNTDAKSQDYQTMKDVYRPSHADHTYMAKYGIRDWRGGGRSSARETIGRVAAGAVAKKILKMWWGIDIVGYVTRIGDIEGNIQREYVTMADVENNVVRCPDPIAAQQMVTRIEQIRKQGDSLGGVIELCAHSVPSGFGAPVFDKLEADLAKAMLSIPACKGFESGSGFSGTYMQGTTHNDPFVLKEGQIRTESNRSGGIQGGISNGEIVWCRMAFKPTATVFAAQRTVNIHGEEVELKSKGRHDPCVLPRAVPIVEAMMALVLLDHGLRQKALISL